MHDSLLDRALDLIWSKYHEPLTLDQMAKPTTYSRWHFLREFSQAIGIPPGQYLKRVRMYILAVGLQRTELPVGYLIDRVGLSRPTAHPAFKKEYRHSPTDYRSATLAGKIALLPEREQIDRRCLPLGACQTDK